VGELNHTLRLTLPARAENIAVVRQALAGVAGALGATDKLVDDIKTAVSEAATNVVAHAYPEGEEGPLEVCATLTGRNLEILVRDRGTGIQPRPVDGESPSLRVGLALIGALTDSFSVSGEEGQGTEVKLVFDLYRDADSAESVGEVEREVGPAEVQIAVRGSEQGGAAIPKVLEMLVARSGLTIDKLADAQLLGDHLAHWNSQTTVDARPMELKIEDENGSLTLHIGPLDPGQGARIIESSELPGLGKTLERLADELAIEKGEHGGSPVEFLRLEIRAEA
jgi:anti-sigma regulatory factor (Ser/Thr protein kinase)